jgi:hypothetical protein
VPAQASQLAESTLADENLRGAWDVRALSRDTRRIHLLIDRGELPLEAIAFAATAASPQAGLAHDAVAPGKSSPTTTPKEPR